MAGFAGLAASYFVAMVMTTRDSPVVAVAELVIRLTPGPVVERAIRILGHHDKPFLLADDPGAVRRALRLGGPAGPPDLVGADDRLRRARRRRRRRRLAASAASGAIDILPVAVGFATWLVCLSLLTEPLRRHERALEPRTRAPTAPEDRDPADHTRRTFLLRAGVIVAGAVVLGVVGRVVGRGRRHVEEARRLLRLPGVTEPRCPTASGSALEGVTPWTTPASDFYRIDTAIVVPTIEPADWKLRIHGMVDREIVLTYQQLIARQVTEAWVTLNCVSNPVGGDLIGNAWWSGVRIADLLAQAGVQPGADAVLQTSDDGWTCGTPLARPHRRPRRDAGVRDERPAAADRPRLPGAHDRAGALRLRLRLQVGRRDEGDPVRRHRGLLDRARAGRELGPVKMSSRIDVPRDGGEVLAAGGRRRRRGLVAAHRHRGGRDRGRRRAPGSPPSIGGVPERRHLGAVGGDRRRRARASTRSPSAPPTRTAWCRPARSSDVLPDGATGWHTIDFSATETTRWVTSAAAPAWRWSWAAAAASGWRSPGCWPAVAPTSR